MSVAAPPPSEPSAARRDFRFPHIVRALGSRNYRLFFGGQSLSLIGTWMTRLATSWLIYKLTGSALLLGALGFVSQLPMFLLSPVAGVLVDRWDRYKIMLATQALSLAQSFLLAALTLTHRITVAEVLALSVMQGFINAFDTPARQSFMIRMVDRREQLGNAIALNSSMVNSARLIGPSLAGILIAVVGIGWCFFWDGVSYLFVIASLLAMRFPGGTAALVEGGAGARRGIWAALGEGWRYVAENRPVRNILLLLAVVSLVGMPYTVLLPLFAARVLHGGARVLGWLMSAVGAGALAGAVSLAARKSVVGLSRVIAWAAVFFGAGLAAFAATRSIWLALPCLAVSGFGFIAQLSSSNTLIQTIVDESKRGRVMSFYAMAFVGMTPFGSLLAGWLATRIGVPATLLACGVCCAAGGFWFAARLPAIRDDLRPIYRRLGILPGGAMQVASTGAAGLGMPPISSPVAAVGVADGENGR